MSPTLNLGGEGGKRSDTARQPQSTNTPTAINLQIGLVVVQSFFHQQSLDAWSSIAPNKMNAPQIEPPRGLVTAAGAAEVLREKKIGF